MLSIYDLTAEERDSILATLNDVQINFVNETMKRGKRTHFARIMASQKGSHIPEGASYEEIESLVDDWVYVNYMDMGFIQDKFKCECGHQLRYVHQVENKQTGQTLTFGINHLKEHLMIDAKIVSLILKGFDVIDFELCEILYKYKTQWDLGRTIGPIPEGFQIPEEFSGQLKLFMPLLDRQVIRLRKLIRIHLDELKKVIQFKSVTSTLGQAAQPVLMVNEGEQITFDLFGEAFAKPSLLKEPVKKTDTEMGKKLILNERFQSLVTMYIREGITRARVICEVLIKSHGASDTRFSTGKPHIYPSVCIYLDELVQKGECRLTEITSEDRTYERYSIPSIN